MKGAANLAAGMVHKQIYKNEHENVGVQAAHRARTTRLSVCKTAPTTRRQRRHIKRLWRKTLS